MPKLPEFRTEEELADWVDTHDTAEYMDEMEDADETFVVKRTHFTTKPLDVRLRTDLFAAIVDAAERRGIPYQMLVQTWLRERVMQETHDFAR
ncbi:MAG: BrnA antitoxin family protein [Caldilineaceae bacterium]|nr:BrnA antitoxin family protein [Caldilineaceae bacterium]